MPKIKIYTTPACVYCTQLKAYLTENKITYEEIDVSRDAKAAGEMVKISNQMSVPVSVIGSNIIIGFDKEKIEKLIRL